MPRRRAQESRVVTMQDLQGKLEKLLTDAEDCDLIGGLTTDAKKRELFQRLATDLRGLARDIEAMIERREVPSHSDKRA